MPLFIYGIYNLITKTIIGIIVDDKNLILCKNNNNNLLLYVNKNSCLSAVFKIVYILLLE